MPATLIARLVRRSRLNTLVRGSNSSLSVESRQHGMVSSVAHTLTCYLQDHICGFVPTLTFYTNHGGLDVFFWQTGPRWWQMRAQFKAQDLPSCVQTTQACQEVVNLHRFDVFCGSMHVVATCILPQKTTKRCRFSFKLEHHNI